MKNHQLLYFLSLFILLLFSDCDSINNNEKEAFISNPKALDAILDKYIEEGYYPFVYARLEDIEGKVLYEHGKVNQEYYRIFA